MKATKLFNLYSGLLIFSGLLFFNTVNLHAQSFNEGSIAVNGGIGILSSINYYAGYTIKRTPVISVSAEYGVKKIGPGILGLGLAFGYQSASYTDNAGSYYYKDKWTTTLFGLRGTYHPDFLNTDKYDVYGVLQLSFDHFGYSFTTNDPYINSNLYGQNTLSSYVRPYFLLGGRYYVSKNFGVFSELGYDISYLKLGITLKFDKK